MNMIKRMQTVIENVLIGLSSIKKEKKSVSFFDSILNKQMGKVSSFALIESYSQARKKAW